MCTQVGQVQASLTPVHQPGAAYWLRGWALPGPLACEVYSDLLAAMGLVSQGRPGTCWCENPVGCGPLSTHSPALPVLGPHVCLDPCLFMSDSSGTWGPGRSGFSRRESKQMPLPALAASSDFSRGSQSSLLGITTHVSSEVCVLAPLWSHSREKQPGS